MGVMEFPPEPGRQAYLPVSDVAEYLAVEPAVVLELIRAGDLNALRVGGQLRVRREDLAEFEATQREVERLRRRFHQAQDVDVIDLFEERSKRSRGR